MTGTRPTPVFLEILDFESECVSFWFRVIWFLVSKRAGSSEVRANAGQRPLRTRKGHSTAAHGARTDICGLFGWGQMRALSLGCRTAARNGRGGKRPRTRRTHRRYGARRTPRGGREGVVSVACTHRVDLDAGLAELLVLLEPDAIFGHAGEDLEAGARLDGADGGLGDEAGADEGVGHGESHLLTCVRWTRVREYAETPDGCFAGTFQRKEEPCQLCFPFS